MARINLLPWRDELRSERQREFIVSLFMTAILGMVLVFMIGVIYEQRIKHQQFRNNLVSTEIQKLEIRIRNIKELEHTRARLISRKRIIEQLQASRSMTVELLDKLAKTIPVGVTLGSIQQSGQVLALSGSSQSNARVSAYLRALDQSDLFLNPELDFVRSAEDFTNAIEPYEFSIRVTLRSPRTADEELELYDQEYQEGTQ